MNCRMTHVVSLCLPNIGSKRSFTSIQNIANVWQFALHLYLIRYLNQLYANCTKSTHFAPKSTYLRHRIENFFWERHGPGEKGTPLPASATRLGASNSAFPELIF